MQKINFKNVLVGLGACVILAFAGLIGIQSAAQLFNSNEIVEDDIGLLQPNPDASSNDECSKDIYQDSEIFAKEVLKDVEYITDITRDKEGNFYIAEFYEKAIHKLDKNFEPAEFSSLKSPYIRGFSGPKSVSVDNNGNIYVVDDGAEYNEMALMVFNSKGEFLRKTKLTDNGFAGNSFDYESTVDSVGNTYVVDSSHHFIEMFDTNGIKKYIWGQIDISGSDDQHFNYPRDIAVGNFNGVESLFVLDVDVNDRLQIFDLKNLNKNPAKTFSPMNLKGGNPAYIEITDSGDIYIMGIVNNQKTLRKYDTDFNLKSTSILVSDPSSGLPTDFTDFVMNSDGTFYMYQQNPSLILKMKNTCGTIIIKKDAVPDDPSWFRFEKDFGNPKIFDLTDHISTRHNLNKETFRVPNAGQYKVWELLKENYQTTAVCEEDKIKDSKIENSLDKVTAIVNVQKGETITCTFTNTKKKIISPETPKSFLDVE